MIKHIKVVSNFVIGTSRIEITLDRAALPQPSFPAGYVSFTGTISDAGSGQIVNDLRARTTDPRVQQICAAWDLFHLKNDDPALDAIADMLIDLDGTRLAQPDETTADLEECSFSNSDDTIDSRDVIARIEYLRNFLGDQPEHEDARAELAILEALENEASGYAPNWRHGETLISDSFFEEYARQLAEDIGAVKSDARWPNNHIDWDGAAEELKQDYTFVSFDGVDYWIR